MNTRTPEVFVGLGMLTLFLGGVLGTANVNWYGLSVGILLVSIAMSLIEIKQILTHKD